VCLCSAYGRGPELVGLYDSQIFLRQSDGALQCIAISPLPAQVRAFCGQSQWTDAIRLCRTVTAKVSVCVHTMAHAPDCPERRRSNACCGRVWRCWRCKPRSWRRRP
jgi:hypothetical protein